MLEFINITPKDSLRHIICLKRKNFGKIQKQFQKLYGQTTTTNHIPENIIKEFYITINNESKNILGKLGNPLFNEKSVMEKSILRRLGEGLNSNERSDYYLALSDLKNSIDYLKQYEGFLLEELGELTAKQQNILMFKINELKNKLL